MNFLIIKIIYKMEKIAENVSNPFEKDRKSLVLQSSKHKESTQEKNVGGCC